MPGELFGRRIRAIVGDQIVCDLDPFADQDTNAGRNLDVTFSTEKHTQLAPLKTTISVWGINRDIREKLTADLKAANAIAWKTRRQVQAGQIDVLEGQEQATLNAFSVNGARIQIYAGYGSDFGLLNTAQILPDGLKHVRDGAGWRTDITAQDNRFLWPNAFVNQTVAGNVSLYDYQAVIDASEAVQSGEDAVSAFTAAFPELTQIKDVPGHKNGFVLYGAAQENRRQLTDVLGLRPFLNEEGQLIYLNPQQTIAGPAVKLAPSTGLLSLEPTGKGFYTSKSLLIHRLRSGTQVLLFREDPDSPDLLRPREVPVDAGVFRVDYAKHSGANKGTEYYTTCTLRPTAIAPTANP